MNLEGALYKIRPLCVHLGQSCLVRLAAALLRFSDDGLSHHLLPENLCLEMVGMAEPGTFCLQSLPSITQLLLHNFNPEEFSRYFFLSFISFAAFVRVLVTARHFEASLWGLAVLFKL